MKKFLLSLAAVALAGSAWAQQSLDVEYNFQPDAVITNIPSLPNSNNKAKTERLTFSLDGNSFTIYNTYWAKNANKGAIALPKTTTLPGAYIEFPAKEGYQIEGVKIKSGNSAMTAMKFSIGTEVQEGSITSTYTEASFKFENNMLQENMPLVIYSNSADKQGLLSVVTITYNKTAIDTREDADLSYPEAEYFVNFSELDSFVAPVLNNPNNLTGIVYESSNEGPAHIDENTGVLTLYPVAGTTTITASFKGNDTYKPCTASYTLTVVDDRKDPGLSFPEAEYTANVGEGFNKPELKNPNNLTVSYSSSNTNVATVDTEGIVTIEGVGTTTITAKFAGNDEYKAGEASYTLKVIDPDALDATFDFTSSVTGTSFTSGIVSAVFDKANGSTAPKWYDPAMRLYAQNTLTISVPEGYYLTSIEFTTDSSNGTFLEGATVNNGIFNSTDKTWAPSAGEKVTSVTLTNSTATKGHTRIQKIVVKYGKDTGTGVESVEVDANAPKEYYNLQGVRVANPEKGLYIVRQGGKASKVVF